MTNLTERWRWHPVPMTAPRPSARWITARVEATLSLYYQPDLSDEADLLAAATWIGVLEDIPREALEQALGEWERTMEKRPTPAGIRKRALARIEKPQVKHDPGLWVGHDEVVPPEELERRREMINRVIDDSGFSGLRRITGLDDD